MDTDCTYIEAEPKIARINDELCEINVRIRLGKETYAVYLKDDISYVYKINTVDPDVVKSIVETN